ncbi:MAG TPA: methionyl-tRNA formyltransferase [Phycisphaerales bacterium]|nr:methionyl-tRNA formyltransferase [Phycisphaerales bacterium]
MKIAVLTSEASWFVPYGKDLAGRLSKKGFAAQFFLEHSQIDESYQVVFILSYFKLIEEQFLNKHKYNLVVHESDLPRGKGWSPLFWQVIEGKNRIPIVLFEAATGVDSGDIYIKDYIELDGNELHDKIREKQAMKTIQMCEKFLGGRESIVPKSQKGEETYYPKRTPSDSELDMNKSLLEQFNLLRTVSNEDFPAFFYYKGNKYILKIFKEECK